MRRSWAAPKCSVPSGGGTAPPRLATVLPGVRARRHDARCRTRPARPRDRASFARHFPRLSRSNCTRSASPAAGCGGSTADVVFQRAVWDSDVRRDRRPDAPHPVRVCARQRSRRGRDARLSAGAAPCCVSQRRSCRKVRIPTRLGLKRRGRDGDDDSEWISAPRPGIPLPARRICGWERSGLSSVQRCSWISAAAFPAHRFVLCGGPGEDAALASQVAVAPRPSPTCASRASSPIRAWRRITRAPACCQHLDLRGFPEHVRARLVARRRGPLHGSGPGRLVGTRRTRHRDPRRERAAGGARRPPGRRGRMSRPRRDARRHAAAVHDIRPVTDAYETVLGSVLRRR